MNQGICGKWHVWNPGNPFHPDKVQLSDEQTKTLREFKSLDDCVNWLFQNGERDAALAFNKLKDKKHGQ